MGTDIPGLMRRLRTGDGSALAELTPALYGPLRRIAARHLRSERSDHTLQPTALVHETYLKLVSAGDREFVDEAHFVALASKVMRQVLVDYARTRGARKRGGGVVQQTWTAELEVRDEGGTELADVIALDTCLSALAAESESKAQLIEMRYFGGMTAEEIAEALGKTVHTVRHELRFAQAWLRRRMASRPVDPGRGA